MKFFTIAELKTHASRILAMGKKQHAEAVITRHGKPLAVLIPIDPDELEWSLREPVRERLRKAAHERRDGKTVPLRRLA